LTFSIPALSSLHLLPACIKASTLNDEVKDHPLTTKTVGVSATRNMSAKKAAEVTIAYLFGLISILCILIFYYLVFSILYP
jgi:hypothetical protein